MALRQKIQGSARHNLHSRCETTMPNNQEVDKGAIVSRDDLELVLPMTKLNPLETHEAVVPAAQVMVHQVFQDDEGTMASEVDPYAHGEKSSSDLKVRPPNSNPDLVTDSEKCIDKDKRGIFG